MAGITGMGTTYNLPNYTGILFQLTPADTPLLSSIGGLSGGGQTTSKEFEWETFDLRGAAQRTKLEGQAAPTAEERVRGNVTNITQIHQEKVSVSYTKLAAIGEKAGINNAAQNPITNELDWQVAQMLKQMALDVNYSLLNGVYQRPTDNTTARQTRGLRKAITTNRIAKGTTIGTGAAVSASADTVTIASHGLSNGDKVYLLNNTAGGLSNDTTYYVVNSASGTFKLATTSGGTAIDVTADGTADVIKMQTAALTTDMVSDLLQSAYDNGGISEQATATLLVNSAQKRAVTKAFSSAYNQFTETSRTVGGVNVTTLITDFGTLNVMLERQMPQHEILVASLEQLMPVFLEVPAKGHFFAEPLAKTGASDEVQLYGEVGLAYGNEKSHAVMTGLAV